MSRRDTAVPDIAPGARAAGWPPPRAFAALAADLEVDFAAADRVALALDIVARCAAKDAPADASWRDRAAALPVGDRIARLLRILGLTTEADAFTIALRCPHAACQRPLEVSLPFARLLESGGGDRDPPPTMAFALPRGVQMRLRRPTGLDQRRWGGQRFANRGEALARIIDTLVVERPAEAGLDGDDIAALAAAMEEFDPLTAFRVITACPHCGCEATIQVDLEAEVLRQLGLAQRTALRDVHILASHYGWSEGAILAIPAARRARYIRMIEDGSAEVLP